MSQVYVSITGLQIKGPIALLRFLWFTLPAMRQALRAPGNLRAEARLVSGVNHTLSVWTDQAAMRAYLTTGAHRKAMGVSKSIGTGRVYGYSAAQAPDWDSALALWKLHGRNI